jgi:hypothetical protein
VENQNWVLVHHEYYVLKDWWQIPILLIIKQIVDGSYISNNITNVLMHSFNDHWVIKQNHVPFIVGVHCMVDCYNLIMKKISNLLTITSLVRKLHVIFMFLLSQKFKNTPKVYWINPNYANKRKWDPM